jgi:coniferyl-aldehyde dehydrogenase
MTDLQTAFEHVHQASRTRPRASPAERQDRLDRLRRMVLANTDAIVAAIAADFGGRAAVETEMMEIVPVVNGIRHAQKSLCRWMRDDKRRVAATFRPARAWVRYEPLGVIGIISPWNYPLQLALAPLTDAFAAGNRALIKPSELTPAFSVLLERMIAETFGPDEVRVVTGGVEVAQAFAALPFDHLVFTGSTAVGRHVMRAAAENLTPVTLELGGKSPAIVCPGYPLVKAARSVAFGKFLNAGQTCIAPDYALVPSGDAEPFARAVLDAATRGYPTIDSNDQYSSIVSERHRARLLTAVEEARAAGATVLSHPEANGGNGKIAPTVVLDAPADGLLMREEIFGPILPVVRYGSVEEAIAFVNGRDRPLAMYCFTSDNRLRDRLLDATLSGGVTVNGTLLHIAQHDLPFGGVGPSGTGAYHGREGFRRFSHARAVHQVGVFNALERLGPPWGRLARLVGQSMLGRR